MREVRTYDEMRDFVKNGDIFFLRKNEKLINKIIRWVTVSPYTHCAIAFWMTAGHSKRLMLIEAQGGTRRRIVNASLYADRDIDVLCAPVPWVDIEDDLLSKIAITEYSYKDAFNVGLKDMLKKRLGININDSTIDKDDKGEICSEMIYRVFQNSEELVTPAELFHRLADAGIAARIALRRTKST